jgi:hypothetical protein
MNGELVVSNQKYVLGKASKGIGRFPKCTQSLIQSRHLKIKSFENRNSMEFPLRELSFLAQLPFHHLCIEKIENVHNVGFTQQKVARLEK